MHFSTYLSNMNTTFSFYRTPRLLFGPGMVKSVAETVGYYGKKAVFLTGAHSLQNSGKLSAIQSSFDTNQIEYSHYEITTEPTPDSIDEIVTKQRPHTIAAVVAIGGGSVLDAGKAVSAMLQMEGSIIDYLEGVGTRKPTGQKIPFIAVPTTAGTGSEASANAVISSSGPQGFKKSLRHQNYVPDHAVIDPELALSCPGDVTAACGMDAFTQLLESYVSVKASPMTDAMVESALPGFGGYLRTASTDNPDDILSRTGLAYAAFISGITLANAGLGTVHGFASSIGGFYPIPHGVICGALLGPVTRLTIEKLMQNDPEHMVLKKYARIGTLLSGIESTDTTKGCSLLVESIDSWTKQYGIPLLSRFEIGVHDIERIVSVTGNKNNPAALSPEDMHRVLLERI